MQNDQLSSRDHQDEADAAVTEPLVATIESDMLKAPQNAIPHAEAGTEVSVAVLDGNGKTAMVEDMSSSSGERGSELEKPKKGKGDHGRRALVKELERLREDQAKLAAEYAALKDRYLRLAAEMENFRKRRERDFSNRLENAVAELFAELLPVVDDLERFFNAGKEKKDYDALASGVQLIYQRILKILQSRGVVAMETLGSEFDPTRHDAIYQMPVDGKAANIVVQESTKGYLLFAKVLRPAKVVVSG